MDLLKVHEWINHVHMAIVEEEPAFSSGIGSVRLFSFVLPCFSTSTLHSSCALDGSGSKCILWETPSAKQGSPSRFLCACTESSSLYLPQDAAPTSSDAADRAEGAEAPGPVTTEEPAEPEPARTPEEEEAAQAEASRLKGEANAAYTDGKLELAYDLYGQALALRPPDSKLQAVLLANRAACGLRLKEVRGKK